MHFFDILTMLDIYICLLAINTFSFVRRLFKSFVFKKQLFGWSFYYWVVRVLYILDTHPLLNIYCILQMFSSRLLIYLKCAYQQVGFFQFCWSLIYQLTSLGLLLSGSCLRNLCLFHSHKYFLKYFLLEALYLSS